MICGELENKYFGCIEDFEKKRVGYEKERKYQPRIVVDDDEDPVSDEDDLWLQFFHKIIAILKSICTLYASSS